VKLAIMSFICSTKTIAGLPVFWTQIWYNNCDENLYYSNDPYNSSVLWCRLW